jgi:hypothetical protein
VTLRTNAPIPELDEEATWLTTVHPKELYRGPYKKLWPYHAKLPKLHHVDFNTIVSLLVSELCIEEFVIEEITRSQDTGEFFYSNENQEWMPEQCLFETPAAARRERSRVLKLIRKWANDE